MANVPVGGLPSQAKSQVTGYHITSGTLHVAIELRVIHVGIANYIIQLSL